MNKINWSAASQILAAASVVVTLIFVGYEIRQNTLVAKAAAAQAFTQQIIDINAIIVARDTPSLNVRLISGETRSEFTDEERFILDINLISLVRVWESVYRGVQAGIVEEDILEPIGARGGIGPFLTPYFAESWELYRPTFTADFIALFEGVLPHLR